MSRTVRRWAPPVAAALVLIAAGAAWAVTRPSSEAGAPVAAAPSVSTVVVDLTATGMQAKCREPEAQRLAGSADFAFEGTVSGIENGRVTLAVTRVFKGEAATTVRVSQADGGSERMLGSGEFEAARNYLIAAADGSVLICGYSGEADAIGLRELYEAAF
ncbi:hypothetical protein QLQ12_24385 [Actinoplanes sp. NEAU-A12]|uniref:Uncharacterized protein n=1 Tax=Actinoplanes sandaracinus TaxID=3045177 RepID=A0ABT6WPY3_9ACTN|nr:hypothetical protein [Actinoplanes sandaracinus]MDI6101764.1 hypothetical protein [Actinoplanes sandaracinus]